MFTSGEEEGGEGGSSSERWNELARNLINQPKTEMKFSAWVQKVIKCTCFTLVAIQFTLTCHKVVYLMKLAIGKFE